MTSRFSRAALIAGVLVLSGGLALAQPAPPAAAIAPAATGTPRETADHIARAIEDIYFDPAKGKAVAADLRAAAARGEFDALTDPRDLATVLTRRLAPIDHHFNVGWSPDAQGPGAAHGPGGPGPTIRRVPGPGGPGGDGPRQADPQEQRGNYGFRRVEMLPGAIGYIDLRQFSNFEFGQPDAPARRAVEAALTLVSGADAVIIDLRDNGGGAPAMVGYLVSAFTPKDANIYNVFHNRDGTASEAPREFYARPRLDVPVYILTSARTGSAAEAFAYTMKAARRGIIVGEASGGAANPGGRVPVGDGFSVFVSGGTPINPITGGNWEGAGVQPDVVVPSADALDRARLLALQAVLAERPDGPESRDTRWVLEAIQAEASPPSNVGDLDGLVGTYNGDLVVTRVGGGLVMQRGRRPASVLVPLGDDVFFVQGEPSRRVGFERDATGKARAMEMRTSSGQAARFRP